MAAYAQDVTKIDKSTWTTNVILTGGSVANGASINSSTLDIGELNDGKSSIHIFMEIGSGGFAGTLSAAYSPDGTLFAADSSVDTTVTSFLTYMNIESVMRYSRISFLNTSGITIDDVTITAAYYS
jgi:hypothetical protein